MVVLARRMGWPVALAATGCFPVPDPAWLIDGPTLLALRAEVTTEGPLSVFVGPVPADRRRTELLPGDGATLIPWVTDVAGPWAPADLDVAYFACFGVYCPDAVRATSAMDPCTATVDLSEPACFVGRGSAVEFVLPSAPLEALSNGVPEILAITGIPGVSDTDTCLSHLRARPTEDLRDCLLLQRYVAVGPRWLMALLAHAVQDAASETEGDTTGGDTTGDTDDPFALPPEVFLEWPNFNPEVERFAVTVDDRAIDAVASDRLAVRPGARVVIEFLDDPRDAQRYATATRDDGTVERSHEGLAITWYATAVLSPFGGDTFPGRQVDWVMPSDTPEVRVDVRVEDGRGGVGWGSLLFEVDATGD